MAIEVKDYKVLKQLLLWPYDRKLVALAIWVAEHGGALVMTDGYDADRNLSSVHSTLPCRGLDVRSTIYADPAKLVEEVNAVWKYDPQRPEMDCAVLHDVGKGMHIHLQVHPRTEFLGR